MRTKIVWMSMALALSLQACGGGTSGNLPAEGGASRPVTVAKPVEGRKTTASKPSKRRPTAAERSSCAAKGILEPGQKEGACTLNGMRLVVANGRSKLRLKLLQATIRGLSIAEHIPQGRGQARARPQGTFIVISLSIENRDDAAHRFGAGQTALAIGNQQYDDSAAVERRFPDALAYARRGAIPPGGVARGEVVFDIPPADVRRVSTAGRLFIANFDANLIRGVGPTGEVGYLRLYI